MKMSIKDMTEKVIIYGSTKVKSQRQIWGRAPYRGGWLEPKFSGKLFPVVAKSYVGLILLGNLINLIPFIPNKTANKATSDNLASCVYLDIGECQH